METLAINPLRVLDCKVCQKITQGAPAPIDSMGEASIAAYKAVKVRLDLLGVPYRENPRLVRGLDYYTRTAFEFVATDFDAAQTALGGGGRYDGLAEVIGGKSAPGVGFAMGIDRIILAMGPQSLTSTIELMVVGAPEFQDAVATVVSQLRQDGLNVDSVGGGRSLNAQLKAVRKTSVSWVVIVAEDFETGRVLCRDIRSGEEQNVTVEEIPQCLKS